MPALAESELDERLQRWADWARCPSPGVASTAAGYLRERHDLVADSAEQTPEITITEKAVARTRLEHKAYWRVIYKYYIRRLALVEIAGFYGISENSCNRLFSEAKGRISDHIYNLEHAPLTGPLMLAKIAGSSGGFLRPEET